MADDDNADRYRAALRSACWRHFTPPPQKGPRIVPANRSRTLEWRRCLKQVWERGGSLEVAIAAPGQVATDINADDAAPPNLEGHRHLVWRVRILNLTDSEILIEQPTTLGQVIDIERGVAMIAILSIGQNRWMFHTACHGAISVPQGERRAMPALRLSMPDSVQRCQRRNHYRVEAPLNLPMVDLWPLLDPRSVIPAERAHEIQFEIDMGRLNGQLDSVQMDFDSVMPEVGPKFGGALLNLGGGGVGVRIAPTDASSLSRHKMFWMRFALPPATSTPICASAKLVHTHMESNHDTYAGMAFDFSFNPSHQRFVVDQICRYIALQQRQQTQHAAPQERRTA
jgi:c-di-GMP-binding flagellar brake protein YcgR